MITAASFVPRAGAALWMLKARSWKKGSAAKIEGGARTQGCSIVCYTILYYTIIYYTILYYTILYYTIL